MAEAKPVVGSAQRRTAFVLAGGGSLGAVEVGMLQALLDWGEAPAFLVGASAGAINAAYFAGDPTAAGARELERIWCALTRREVLPFNLGSVFGLLRRRDHLVDSSGLRRLLERHLPYRQLEDAALPVHLVASDMLNGREVLLSTGPVVDAVLASAAIPGVYPPVQIDGRWLVDGGVANNTPISVAFGLGATRVIVLPTGFACALERAPSGAVARAMHALSLLVARQLVQDADRFAADATVELRIVPSLCPLDVSPYDYSAAARLITRARTETDRWLEGGGLDRAGTPRQLREHHD
ncbi:alpha/beta hydrolase [Rhodanobacter thiooxydans]|uniref:Alpha/beta hydrolase n=1 Tax=Rhodanobacter thiooxydans TaxID=416169 RepID=A0A154QFD2_9GAMM|nr:patatin-like phospholipase family protein [Rhodanobacter thiooxydans]EIM01355.1 Patatin [Rhodanobacter thiooxydans LCS2]KZC22982.1 alpha/beta hydrolase [Rhodanobacter thiooxydans]